MREPGHSARPATSPPTCSPPRSWRSPSGLELFAEIGGLDLRITAHLSGSPASNDLTEVEYTNFRGEAEHEVDVVLDHQDRQVAFPEHRGQRVTEALPLLTIESGGRLVQQQNRRVEGERTGDLDQPCLTEWQADHSAFCDVRDSQHLDHGIDRLGLFSTRASESPSGDNIPPEPAPGMPRPPRQHNVIPHAEGSEDLGVLKGPGQASLGSLLGTGRPHVLAVEDDGTLRRTQQARQHREESALAVAVPAY